MWATVSAGPTSAVLSIIGDTDLARTLSAAHTRALHSGSEVSETNRRLSLIPLCLGMAGATVAVPVEKGPPALDVTKPLQAWFRSALVVTTLIPPVSDGFPYHRQRRVTDRNVALTDT